MMRLALASLLVLLAGCTQVHGSHQPPNKDILRVGSAIAPNSFNELLSTESVENMLDQFIFSKLLQVDSHGQLQPDLALAVPTQANGGISKDGLTITYHLRHGVKWQDGAPFTSRDVKFTFDQVMNPHNNVSSRVGYEDVSRVDTPDDYTVAFHLKQPYGPIVDTLFCANVSPENVLPEHLLRGLHDLNNIPFNSAPVGTGPYRMAKWVRDDHIEFDANPTYFRGKPKISKIIVYLIPQENTDVNELRTGELDWFFRASEASYNQLHGMSGVRTIIAPQNSYRGMLINTQSPLVSDVRVRQAIAYAINKKAFVPKVTYGAGTVATEDIPSFMWAYNPKVKVYNYDPQQSRALLRAAGWRPGADGVVQKNGQRMDLRFVLRQGAAADTAMSVVIQSELRDVGIATSIKTFPGSLLFMNGTSGILTGGHYDIDLSGFGSGFDPDNAAQFTCRNRPPNGYDWSFYCSPEMDAAQAQALGTYDQAKRKAAYAKVEDLLARDVPQIFMYWEPEIDAVNPSLKNFEGNPFQISWNAWDWHW